MISDEQRRDVAQRMRNEIHFMRLNREWYEAESDAVECGNRAFRDIAHSVIPFSYLGNDYIEVVERLADLIDRDMVEDERLKKENAELKAELADWKGNAEGFQPDAYMKLPLDADGKPIRIGDEVTIYGAARTVLGYRLYDDMILLVANNENGLIFAHEPSKVRHFKQAPADSWEKLEEDVNLGCRDYCEKYRLEECDYNMRVHMLDQRRRSKMRINDEKRREVAEELRSESESWRDTFPSATIEEEALGAAVMSDLLVFVGLDDSSPVHAIYERLADLIDRPTCKNVSEFGSNTGSNFDFVCSRCGSRLMSDKMHGSPLVDDRFRHYSINFCPNCGAEVVE